MGQTYGVTPREGQEESAKRYACRRVNTGSSGRQEKRAGRMLVPVPRLTYARPAWVLYQPETKRPLPRGSAGAKCSVTRICPACVCPASARAKRAPPLRRGFEWQGVEELRAAPPPSSTLRWIYGCHSRS